MCREEEYTQLVEKKLNHEIQSAIRIMDEYDAEIEKGKKAIETIDLINNELLNYADNGESENLILVRTKNHIITFWKQTGAFK